MPENVTPLCSKEIRSLKEDFGIKAFADYIENTADTWPGLSNDAVPFDEWVSDLIHRYTLGATVENAQVQSPNNAKISTKIIEEYKQRERFKDVDHIFLGKERINVLVFDSDSDSFFVYPNIESYRSSLSMAEALRQGVGNAIKSELELFDFASYYATELERKGSLDSSLPYLGWSELWEKEFLPSPRLPALAEKDAVLSQIIQRGGSIIKGTYRVHRNESSSVIIKTEFYDILKKNNLLDKIGDKAFSSIYLGKMINEIMEKTPELLSDFLVWFFSDKNKEIFALINTDQKYPDMFFKSFSRVFSAFFDKEGHNFDYSEEN